MKYHILILFLLFSTKILACWEPSYTPGEYLTFYAENWPEQNNKQTTQEQNILEWKKYTSNRATYYDIEFIVYKVALKELEHIGSDAFTKQDQLYNTNSFVKYIIDNRDKEAIQYLILAKKCEERRLIRRDPWWYPTKDDLKFTDLQEILEEALSYKGTKLSVRYWLQAIRAAYTMGEYDICLNLWNEYIKSQPASAVKTMCEEYIGGIYFKRGEFEKAIQHYAKTTQQSQSFWWCMKNMTKTKPNADIERIKILYRYFPSSPELAWMVQDICREAESSFKSRNRYIALRDFALQVVSEKRTNNPALWKYTAAFLTMLDGDLALAQQYTQDAVQLKGPTSLKDNIKVLNLILEAMTGTYDETFEEVIFPQLQWLDGKIKSNLTQSIKKYNIYYDQDMFANCSFFYFNDMMRKITLSIMAPRYNENGQPVKALLLAGMASERLRTLTGFRKQSHKIINDYHKFYFQKNNSEKEYEKNVDYYTDIFQAMDSAAIEDVIAYRDILKKGGQTDFERFLVARCYKNSNYFNELIGTKYMREEQFDKAVEYLSKVSSKYEKTLNIYPYFDHNPFDEPFFGTKYIEPVTGYKLKFAKQMSVFQKEMNNQQDEQKRITATYKYALGLLRATSDCWALLFYKRGYPDWLNINLVDNNEKMEAHSRELFKQILKTSSNKELKAKCLALELLLNRGSYEYVYDANDHTWKTLYNANFTKPYRQLFSPEYADTKIAKQLFSECYNFILYEKEQKKVK